MAAANPVPAVLEAPPVLAATLAALSAGLLPAANDVPDLLRFTPQDTANTTATAAGGADASADTGRDGQGAEMELVLRERGVAYGEEEETEAEARCTVVLCAPPPPVGVVQLVAEPTERWGLNFAGVLLVAHPSEEAALAPLSILLPGVRTYDPAGRTGDPHASERIGPSCARLQTAITVVQAIAALRGAGADGVDALQAALRPVIDRYHGRAILFEWMREQVVAAIVEHRDPVPYPAFVAERAAHGAIDLDAAESAHTREYLGGWERGEPQPPTAYFLKQQTAEDMAVVSGGDGGDGGGGDSGADGLALFERLCSGPVGTAGDGEAGASSEVGRGSPCPVPAAPEQPAPAENAAGRRHRIAQARLRRALAKEADDEVVPLGLLPASEATPAFTFARRAAIEATNAAFPTAVRPASTSAS